MSAPKGAKFGPLWSELVPPLCASSLAVLSDLGFARATPVQAAVVPLLCTNKDVAVEACTGSGKTLAFVLPLVEIVRKAHADTPLKKHEVAAVVVSPTRELARQTLEVAAPFVAAALQGPKPLLLVGGSDPSADVNRFYEEGAHVLVGTPGRIDDVLTRSGSVSLRRCELLVLDEADRLLSMGFAPQVNAIIRRLPKQRRTGLFSATQTDEVAELARAGLRNPMRITVRDVGAAATGPDGTGGAPTQQPHQSNGHGCLASKTPAQLRLLYTTCRHSAAKLPALASFLRRHGPRHKVLVYFLTCACVDFFAHALRTAIAPDLFGDRGGTCTLTALHGRMEQAKRQRALEAFAAAPHGVLLATDVAARGLDIPGVDWVLQFDPPQEPDAFVHRCGRTARMGAAGSAAVFLLPHEDSYIEFLRRRGVNVAHSSGDGADDADDDLFAVHSDDGQRQHPGDDDDACRSVCAALRLQSETEREAMDRGVRAFVSFVRGYQEHSCRFIFRLKELDLGSLASSLGLLRLPRMPETKHLRGPEKSQQQQHHGGGGGGGGGSAWWFTASAVDPETVPYKDKAREKQRQQRLLEQHQGAPATSVPQRQHQPGGPRKPGRGDASAAPAAPTTTTQHRLPAQKRRAVQQRADDDDLDDDWKMLKKLKAGKISEHEYNVACGLSSDSDQDEAKPQSQAPRAGKKGARQQR